MKSWQNALQSMKCSIDPREHETGGEKDQVMQAFYRGEIDVLVATVVIEVGINVPNASVIVIENAERFGLAQLHQLRGRVGRGRWQSYCFLITQSQSELAQKRGEIMQSSSDGFFIAEEDMKLRGPGDIFGTRQHGIPELNVADLAKHLKIMEHARQEAKKIPCGGSAFAERRKRRIEAADHEAVW